MKKLISILIPIIIIARMLAVPVFAEKNSNTEYWNTMESFGVVKSDVNKDSTFTIADMSKMIYRLLNLQEETEPEATHQIYTDVDRWHWAAGYIEWLYNNSVYTGDGSGVLEPDRAVLLSDISAVALNLLGHTKMMEVKNDDTDSIMKAAEIGLFSAVGNKKEHEVTYDEFAAICFKMLFTDVVKTKFSNKLTYTYGGEFITEVLELDYNKGIMTGANGYSLNDDYCASDGVIIDGLSLRIAMNTQYSDCIGYRVKYYYDSEDHVLISAVPHDNEEFIIKSEDILKYQNNTYTIEENGRKKTKKGENVLLLYNGKTTTNRNAFTPVYGQVRLIDNDGDGKFECVISEDAVNIVLEKIVDGIIYGKNTDVNGQKYAIDTTDLEMVKFVGNSVPVEELKENTIISVVVSEDGKYGCFYVSDEKKNGILDRFADDMITVDGIEYNKSNKMYNPDAIISGATGVEIYLDTYGNVASIITTNENMFLFGYLMHIGQDDIGEKLVLKILTSEGGIQRLYTSERPSIDGNRMKTPEAAKNSLRVNEVIRYRLFNGEIVYIDTATRNSGFSNFSINSDRDALTMIAKGENMLYKSSPQIFKHYGTNMDVHAEFAIDDDTTVFFVPTATEYQGDRDYYVGNKSLLKNDLTAGVQAYVTSSDTLFAEVVVVNYSTQVVLATGFTIVDKLSVTLDSDDEIVGQIHGLCNGNEINVLVPDQSLLTNIGKGSIIRYQANKDGEVKSISNIYGLNGTGSVNTSATHSWTSGSSGVNANVRVVLGYIQQTSGTVARFKFKNDASADELFNLKNCNIYVYEEGNRGHLRVGNIDDLYDYAHYGSSCDEVIICTRAAAVSDVFLIRR